MTLVGDVMTKNEDNLSTVPRIYMARRALINHFTWKFSSIILDSHMKVLTFFFNDSLRPKTITSPTNMQSVWQSPRTTINLRRSPCLAEILTSRQYTNWASLRPPSLLSRFSPSSTRCRSSENSHSHLSTRLSRFRRRCDRVDCFPFMIRISLFVDVVSPLSTPFPFSTDNLSQSSPFRLSFFFFFAGLSELDLFFQFVTSLSRPTSSFSNSWLRLSFRHRLRFSFEHVPCSTWPFRCLFDNHRGLSLFQFDFFPLLLRETASILSILPFSSLSFDFISSSSRSFRCFANHCFQISRLWLGFCFVEIVSTIFFLSL